MEDYIREVNQASCEGILEWAEQSGVGDNYYYARRVKTGKMLTSSEVKTARYIANNFPIFGVRYLEVGAGCGQFSFLLASTGRHVTVMEHNIDRFEQASNALKRLPVSTAERVTLLQSRYPIDASPGAEIIITHNIASNFWDKWSHPNKLQRFYGQAVGILDARVWWAIRSTEKEREQLMLEIEASGYNTEWLFDTMYRIHRKESK